MRNGLQNSGSNGTNPFDFGGDIRNHKFLNVRLRFGAVILQRPDTFPIRLTVLPRHFPDPDMGPPRPGDTDLESPAPRADAGSRRRPVAWIERDCIDLGSGLGTRSYANDIGSQPIEVDDRSGIFPKP